MSLFLWNDKLSVHHPVIDRQHRELFRLAECLHDAMMRGAGRPQLSETLAELVECARHHVQTEEALMRSSSYAAYAEHKKEHDKLIQQITDLQAGFNAGSVTITVAVMLFLRNGLEHHIVEADQKVGAHLTPRAEELTGARR